MLVAVLAALGALLGGCGDTGPSEQEKREARERLEHAEERKAELLATARAKECFEQIAPFLERLEELGSRLEVGLSYDEYLDELGTIQVAYNRLPINELHQRCLSRVGVPSEKAFQAYVHASEIWEDCIDTLSCEDGVDPEVQADWNRAGAKVEQALTLGIVEVGTVGSGDRRAAAKVVKAGSSNSE